MDDQLKKALEDILEELRGIKSILQTQTELAERSNRQNEIKKKETLATMLNSFPPNIKSMIEPMLKNL
jgi:F0F1-type ATP synthase delta subunit